MVTQQVSHSAEKDVHGSVWPVVYKVGVLMGTFRTAVRLAGTWGSGREREIPLKHCWAYKKERCLKECDSCIHRLGTSWCTLLRFWWWSDGMLLVWGEVDVDLGHPPDLFIEVGIQFEIYYLLDNCVWHRAWRPIQEFDITMRAW